jgi:hypothetical protein
MSIAPLHPLAPPLSMTLAEVLSGVAQDFSQTRSLIDTTVCTIARELSRWAWIEEEGALYSGWYSLACKSILIIEAVDDEKLQEKISWVAPVVSIGLTTAIAYAAYGLISSAVFRAILGSIHGSSVGILSAPSLGGERGIMSLQRAISYGIGVTEAAQKLNDGVVKLIANRADYLAFLAFAVSSIGLTVLRCNPILATTAGYVISTTVKMVVMRLLMSYHLGQPTTRPS